MPPVVFPGLNQSLCSLCLCAESLLVIAHHRDAEVTEVAHRRTEIKMLPTVRIICIHLSWASKSGIITLCRTVPDRQLNFSSVPKTSVKQVNPDSLAGQRHFNAARLCEFRYTSMSRRQLGRRSLRRPGVASWSLQRRF